MKPYLEAFLRLLYPGCCAVCTSLLEIHEHGLCTICQGKLEELRYSADEAAIDVPLDHLDHGWTVYPYESPVKEILLSIKFLKKRWLVKNFASQVRMLALAVASENVYDGVIPVPLDREKLIVREFNQSELVAAQISKTTGLPLAVKILTKPHKTAAQSLLTREQRKINLYRAFRVRKPDAVKGKRFLLVDDIFTTGRTAEEAAVTLKEHGAKRVDLFALARTEAAS